MDIQVGDILKLKKQHPCGSSQWEVLIPRKQAEKSIRQITKPEPKE